MNLSRREFAAGAAVSVLPLAGCGTDHDMVIYNEQKTKTTAQVRVTGVETLFNQKLTIKPDSYRYFENAFEGEVDDTLEVYVNVQGGPEKTETISEVHGTVNIEISPNDIKIASSVE